MFRSTHPATIAKKKAAKRKQRKLAVKNFKTRVRKIRKILTTK